MQNLDWNKLSESEAKELAKWSRQAVFIMGSRELSAKRIEQFASLAKQKPVLWGVLKDEFVAGFAGSPQFRTLQFEGLNRSLAASKNIRVLSYFQRDIIYIAKSLKPANVLGVNGSWHKVLHVRPEYWEFINKGVRFNLVSPFSSETAAREFAEKLNPEVSRLGNYVEGKKYNDEELLTLAGNIAKRSYATDWQTGAVLAHGGKVLATAHNSVVPYETAALHEGSSREKHFSPPNDLNHYDTIHAEAELLLIALREKLSLKGTALYINLLPCPTCAKLIGRSEVQEIFYQHDHSEGYAFKLLSRMGKKLHRLPA